MSLKFDQNHLVNSQGLNISQKFLRIFFSFSEKLRKICFKDDN